mmetsp:Transcript_25256/g.95421  ORF Transcript_25256/g.95421 Transcript_25256/m.95421 type:complete len:248 (-) Transcript_25256:1258-2001(-)
MTTSGVDAAVPDPSKPGRCSGSCESNADRHCVRHAPGRRLCPPSLSKLKPRSSSSLEMRGMSVTSNMPSSSREPGATHRPLPLCLVFWMNTAKRSADSAGDPFTLRSAALPAGMPALPPPLLSAVEAAPASGSRPARLAAVLEQAESTLPHSLSEEDGPQRRSLLSPPSASAPAQGEASAADPVAAHAELGVSSAPTLPGSELLPEPPIGLGALPSAVSHSPDPAGEIPRSLSVGSGPDTGSSCWEK